MKGDLISSHNRIRLDFSLSCLSGTEARTRFFNSKKLIRAYISIPAIPAIQTTDAIDTAICKGLTLSPIAGAKVSAITGLTALLTTRIPESITGFCSYTIFVGITSELGTRLNTLSMENGRSNLTATKAHKRQLIHFGAFLRSRRRIITARINQPAVRLIFRIFRKTVLICFSP